MLGWKQDDASSFVGVGGRGSTTTTLLASAWLLNYYVLHTTKLLINKTLAAFYVATSHIKSGTIQCGVQWGSTPHLNYIYINEKTQTMMISCCTSWWWRQYHNNTDKIGTVLTVWWYFLFVGGNYLILASSRTSGKSYHQWKNRTSMPARDMVAPRGSFWNKHKRVVRLFCFIFHPLLCLLPKFDPHSRRANSFRTPQSPGEEAFYLLRDPHSFFWHESIFRGALFRLDPPRA